MYAIIMKRIIIISMIFISSIIFSCKTVYIDIEPVVFDEYRDFLSPDQEANELFRVLIISDRYDSSQMKFQDSIKRVEDEEGDRNISDKLKEYDKIDETCEGVLTVSLYPDSGKLMKIRPKALASIVEVNSLIVEDLKRWNFEFIGDAAEPNVFDIRYRVVLRKMQSDEEIMKEVMERAKKEEQKKETQTNDD